MKLQSKFLTLSMKSQICITIIILTLFCILVILAICCSLVYEILKVDYIQKKKYFYNSYKDYLESCFYFKNFCLLQYEEIIRRMQKQSWKYHQTLYTYNTTRFDDYSNAVIDYNDSLHKDIENEKTDEDNSKLFILCYWEAGDSLDENTIYNHNIFCPVMHEKALGTYQALSNSIFSNNIYDSFKIPNYNIPIMSSPLFTNVNYSSIFSFNASRIHKKLLEVQNENSSYIDHDRLKLYFHRKILIFVENINYMFNYFFFQNLELFDHMFSRTYNEIKKSLNGVPLKKDPASLYMFSRISAGYLSSINYGNSEFSLISYGADNNFYYSETNIINEFLYFILNELSSSLDMNFIPLFNGNNTIISPELCFLFILKQFGFQVDENIINEFYNKIKKGESTIEDCFAYKNIIDSQTDIKYILNLNFTTFLSINNLLHEGIMHLGNDKKDFPYFFISYSYPNYNILKEFQSEYLLLDQVNFYFYSSFKLPIKYVKYIYYSFRNCFFLVVIIIIYIWFICLFINLLIFYKVINEWTEPIKNLQKAVESNNIKDENIFKYNYDDIINELFITCKELLTKQICNTNNENGLKNYSIFSNLKEKEKEIDQNIYKKNLIINNDILNQILNEQQNMMNFSNNIKLNNNEITNENQENNKKYENISDENLASTIDNYTKENINNNFNKEDNIIKEYEQKNEHYKNLFRIAEYMHYHKSKLIKNNIFIENSENSTNYEGKIKKFISKENINSINTDIKNNINLKNSIKRSDLEKIKENNDSTYINMLDKQDITYLWYMEEKNKNNKSFNYNISYNYKELFME